MSQWIIIVLLIVLCPLIHFFIMRGRHGKHEEHTGNEPENKDDKKNHSGRGCCH